MKSIKFDYAYIARVGYGFAQISRDLQAALDFCEGVAHHQWASRKKEWRLDECDAYTPLNVKTGIEHLMTSLEPDMGCEKFEIRVRQAGDAVFQHLDTIHEKTIGQYLADVAEAEAKGKRIPWSRRATGWWFAIPIECKLRYCIITPEVAIEGEPYVPPKEEWRETEWTKVFVRKPERKEAFPEDYELLTTTQTDKPYMLKISEGTIEIVQTELEEK